MPRLIRICLKRVLIDAIIVSVCVVFFVILRDLRVSEKFPPKNGNLQISLLRDPCVRGSCVGEVFVVLVLETPMLANWCV